MYKKILLTLLASSTLSHARHPFRIVNQALPEVTAQWIDGSGKTTTVNRYLRYYPNFFFNTKQFYRYLLPKDAILYHQNKTRAVSGTLLSNHIEDALAEISIKKKSAKKDKSLENFIILQDKNFNYKELCGLIVLAFKEYPFVVKLFIERPETIYNYHATGMEPTFFFYMGGGSNRHMSGLTRIENRVRIDQSVKTLDRWKNHVTMPRKWFWLPQDQQPIVLIGKNIGGLEQVSTEIPGTYAIVADKIDFEHQTNVLSPEKKRKMFMQLCNDLELTVDPHAKNFALLEDKVRKKFTITLVDTEHFPTMVGQLGKVRFRNHNEWYLYLAGKCFHDMYMQSKRDLIEAGNRSVEKYYHNQQA